MTPVPKVDILFLLTGLPGSGGWRRQYPSSYLGECVNDASAGKNKHEDVKAYSSASSLSHLWF